jgi:hypothetical protein
MYLNLPLPVYNFFSPIPINPPASPPLFLSSHPSILPFLIPPALAISYATTNLHRYPRSVSLGRPRHLLRSIEGRLAHSIAEVR